MMKRILLAAAILASLITPASAFQWGSVQSTPAGGVQVLAQGATPVSTVGSVAETTLASIVVPGGTMGNNGALRLTIYYSTSNSANNKIVKYKIGSTIWSTFTVTTVGTCVEQRYLRNRNSQSSQIMFQGGNGGSYGASSGVVQASAVNTANDQTVTVTGTTSLETGFAATSTTGNGTTVTVTKSSHGLNTGEYVQVSGATPSGYNADPVQITVVDANTFTYLSSATGAVSVQPTVKRYSVIQLEGYTLELLPGVP